METKIQDLKTVLGTSVSQNQSPTGNAKLVKICKNYCVFISLQSEYTRYPLDKVGVKYKVPTAWAWNAYFF